MECLLCETPDGMKQPILEQEEYVEQEYFFRVYRERMEDKIPSQEILQIIHEEVLATTKLPVVIEFLLGEMMLKGRISDGMAMLPHYFAPFQTFVMSRAEQDDSKFDQHTALQVLEREAQYRAAPALPTGLFIFQFECIARNRLGYDQGMQAMSQDPMYDQEWTDWILKARLRLGSTDFGDLIYFKSEYYLDDRRRRDHQADLSHIHPLFGINEGRIAKANRGKDPLFMFAALQRHLGYPVVPRPKPKPIGPIIHPQLEQRLHQLEMRLKLLELETRDELDLSKFYVHPPPPPSDDNQPFDGEPT